MVTYEYKCESCGKKFTREFHFNDNKTSVSCPFCHSRKTRRLFSVPEIIFKGPGFYVNEYSSDSNMKKENSQPENK